MVYDQFFVFQFFPKGNTIRYRHLCPKINNLLNCGISWWWEEPLLVRTCLKYRSGRCPEYWRLSYVNCAASNSSSQTTVFEITINMFEFVLQILTYRKHYVKSHHNFYQLASRVSHKSCRTQLKAHSNFMVVFRTSRSQNQINGSTLWMSHVYQIFAVGVV